MASVANLLLLAGCGCDSSSPAVPPSPAAPAANSAPVFTSASASSIPESRSGPAYQAAATDADGDALVYSLSGGNDAAQFTITPAGAISFVSPPDYEASKDTNADNVYEVALAVSDGRNVTTLTLRLTVENQRYRVRQLAANFVEPQRVMAVGDGSGRLYVVERRGLVWLYDPSTNVTASTPFLDLRSEVSTDGERGLLNVIVNQQKNNIGTLLYVSVYACFTDGAGDIVVQRYITPSATNFEQVVPATAREFLRVPHPSNRNLGGALDLTGIGTQGGPLLWVGFGDTDGTAANSRVQDPTSLLGKLVVGIVSNLNEGSSPSPPPFTQLNLPYPYSLISSFGVRNPKYYSNQLACDETLVLHPAATRDRSGLSRMSAGEATGGVNPARCCSSPAAKAAGVA